MTQALQRLQLAARCVPFLPTMSEILLKGCVKSYQTDRRELQGMAGETQGCTTGACSQPLSSTADINAII